MFKDIFKIILILISPALFSQSVRGNSVYEKLTEKNYFLLFELQYDTAMRNLLNNNNVLKKYTSQREKNLEIFNGNPDAKIDYISPYLFSDTEISATGTELKKLAQKTEAKDFIKKIRKSGAYINKETLRDPEFLEAAWKICAEGINHTLKIYGRGEKPRYDKMDSISYDPKSEFLKFSIFSWGKLVAGTQDHAPVFFTKPLNMALSALYLNHRDEAVRYEPLMNFNKKAADFAKAKPSFPYSSIIVLGNGPENTDRLSSLGKFNLQVAASYFFDGKAPFIIVSGGHAHPFRTVFAEAIEMKKELMDVYHIDEKNIIIEPYARHTTTNLRNAARLMMDYGISLARPSLVVSNQMHIASVASPEFLKRCETELGYHPGTFGKIISPFALEFYPNELIRQQNPMEPLDP